MVYSDIEFFIEHFGAEIPEDKIDFFLNKASREINKYLISKPADLTELSEYENEIFNYTCCELAIFLYKNNKYANTIVNSLSIAGTSYSFDTTTAQTKINDILSSLNDTQYMNRYI